LSRSGRFKEAAEQHLRALQLQPDCLDAYLELTNVYQQAGNKSRAISAARKALGLAQSTGQAEKARQVENWLLSVQ
jgi:tetratricopeptide (TPR) repeat protein